MLPTRPRRQVKREVHDRGIWRRKEAVAYPRRPDPRLGRCPPIGPLLVPEPRTAHRWGACPAMARLRPVRTPRAVIDHRGTVQDPQLCQSACAMCRQSSTETDLERAEGADGGGYPLGEGQTPCRGPGPGPVRTGQA